MSSDVSSWSRSQIYPRTSAQHKCGQFTNSNKDTQDFAAAQSFVYNVDALYTGNWPRLHCIPCLVTNVFIRFGTLIITDYILV